MVTIRSISSGGGGFLGLHLLLFIYYTSLFDRALLEGHVHHTQCNLV